MRRRKLDPGDVAIIITFVSPRVSDGQVHTFDFRFAEKAGLLRLIVRLVYPDVLDTNPQLWYVALDNPNLHNLLKPYLTYTPYNSSVCRVLQRNMGSRSCEAKYGHPNLLRFRIDVWNRARSNENCHHLHILPDSSRPQDAYSSLGDTDHECSRHRGLRYRNFLCMPASGFLLDIRSCDPRRDLSGRLQQHRGIYSTQYFHGHLVDPFAHPLCLDETTESTDEKCCRCYV